jgi:hypothetical protein
VTVGWEQTPVLFEDVGELIAQVGYGRANPAKAAIFPIRQVTRAVATIPKPTSTHFSGLDPCEIAATPVVVNDPINTYPNSDGKEAKHPIK